MGSIQIHNVVAVASLGQKIDLLPIMKVFRNVDYRPTKFPGLVFRLKVPKTSTLIFSTGKMVCTGAKSEKEARSAVKKVVLEMKKAGFIILREPEITIQNIVASAEVDGEIDIERASSTLDNIMYEPEQFPAAIYRMDQPRVVFLIFHTGKLVVTGAKKEEEIHEAAESLLAVLTENNLLPYRRERAKVIL